MVTAAEIFFAAEVSVGDGKGVVVVLNRLFSFVSSGSLSCVEILLLINSGVVMPAIDVVVVVVLFSLLIKLVFKGNGGIVLLVLLFVVVASCSS